MSTRMVDRNGMRGGAGISAVVLVLAFVLSWEALIPVVAVTLSIGALLGLRASPLGALYRAGKRTLRLDIPLEPEEEAPPRFAQALGAAVLWAATAAIYPVGSEPAGWVLTLAVAALQALLALTGFCLGCQIYLLGRRFSAKGT